MMARRTAFAKVAVFNAKMLHGDVTDWELRARENGVGVELLPDVLTRRRMQQLNTSRVQQDEMRDQYLRLVKANLDRRRRD